MTNKQEHNTEARYFDNQVVIFDTTPASATNGSLVVGGGLSAKDTYVSGHVAVNNVRITPNLNDIVYELESILVNNVSEWTGITDFNFDSSVATSFKAMINVTVSTGSAKYALWEINGVYKPSGWTITSSFTGDMTGVNFTIETENGTGYIKYKNLNTSGTTTIRFRASTNAPPGSNPVESTGLINNTSGPYIANRLLYANSVNTIANVDVSYQNSILSVGGSSRLVTENAGTFTNFSNGGSITSMGDASVAKKLIVGEKVGIVNTSPQFTLDVAGDINFTGAFYNKGSLYTGNSVWETNNQNDVYYTRGNLGIGTTDPAYSLDIQGDARINNISTGSANISHINALNITSGTVIASMVSSGSLAATNVTLGSMKATDATIDALTSTHMTTSNIVGTNTTMTNITTGILIASTGITAGSSGITDISSSNIVAVNITTGTVNAVGVTAGNINFTGNLYQNGALYISSQWKSGDWSTISYNSGNVGVGTTSPTRTLDVVGSGSFTEGVTTGSLKTTDINATNSTLTNIVNTNISSGFMILSTGMVTTNISTGKLIASDGLTAGSSQISSVSGTNSTFTNATATNLVGTNTTITNATATNLVGTNTTMTNISSGTARLTNIVATNSTLGTVNMSGGTIGGHLVPSTNVTYNLGSADLRWNDIYLSGNTIHLGEKQLTLAGDTFTVEKLSVTNTSVATSASSGALVIGGGLGAVNANITNIVSNNISSGTANISNLSSSTINSTLIAATTITGANLSLSGNLNVAGTLTVVNITATNLMDTNLTAGVARVTTSLAAVGNSNTIGNIFTTGGNVGIGTGTPLSRLQVNGDISLSGSQSSPQYILANGLADDSSLVMRAGSTGALSQIRINSNWNGTSGTGGGLFFSTNNTERMRVNADGNVGIGTTAPSTQLHVNGNIQLPFGGRFTTIVNDNFIHLNNTVGHYSLSWNSDNANGSAAYLVGYAGVKIFTAGASRMFVDFSGNVGIGNTSPAFTLDVTGSGRFTGGVTVGNLEVTGLTDTLNLTATNVSTSNIVTISDQVIGSKSIANQGLHLQWNRSGGDGESWIINQQGAGLVGGMRFGTSNTSNSVTEWMRITSSGNLGIGTVSPSNNLDVWGNSGFDQTAGLRLYNNSSQYGRTQLQLVGRFELSNDAWSTSPRNAIMFQQQTAQGATINTKYIIQNFGEQLGILNGSGTPLMVWNSTGNIGISSTNPTTAKLVIGGSAGATGLDLASSDQYAELRVIRNALSSLDKDMYLQIGAGTGSKLRMYSNNSETMTLNGGNVGINTTSPSFTLDVAGTARVSTAITTGGLEITGTGVVDTPNLTVTTAATISSLNMSGAARVINIGHAQDTTNYSMEIYAPSSTGLSETSIRFHQEGRYWQQIRAYNSGFKFTQGDSGTLVSIQAAGITGSTATVTTGITTGMLEITGSGVVDTPNLTVTTAATISSLSVTGFSTLNGGSKVVVQNSQDGGTGRGIYLWAGNDPNWGIYMGQSGVTKSLNGGTACTGAGGFAQHAIRIRTTNSANQGLIYENSAEACLFSVRGSDGMSFIAGNLGIGNASPSFNLDVSGTARVTNSITTGGLNVTGNINFTGNLTQNGVVYGSGGGSIGQNISVTNITTSSIRATGDSNLLGQLFTNTYTIGMFTSSGSSGSGLLQVNGNISNYSGGTIGYIVLATGQPATTGYISFCKKDATTEMIIGAYENNAYIDVWAAKPLFFNTNQVPRMTMSVSGDIGIGTTSPAFKLDVSGTARITTGITTGGLKVTGLTDTLNLTATNVTISSLNVTTFNPLNINTTNITTTNMIVATALTCGNIWSNGITRSIQQIITGTANSFSLMPKLQMYASTDTVNPIFYAGAYNGAIAGYGLGAYLNGAGSITMSTSETSFFVGKDGFGWGVQRCTGSTGSAATATVILRILNSGSASFSGSLSKASGTFDIEHPNDSTKRLVHSFIEGPRCDLIYRGQVNLVDGTAVVNLDTDCVAEADCAMTEGTFESLCANPQYSLQNHTSFNRVKGAIQGNILIIECEDSNSTDTVYWSVIAERKDRFIKQWDKTNSNGYLVTEYIQE